MIKLRAGLFFNLQAFWNDTLKMSASVASPVFFLSSINVLCFLPKFPQCFSGGDANLFDGICEQDAVALNSGYI